MRILHVVRQFYPAVGGLENFVLSLAMEQKNNGIDAEVLTLNRIFHQSGSAILSAEDIVQGVKVIRISWSGSYKYPFAPTVLSHLNSFDLIHVHGIDFFFDFLSLTQLIHKKPLVASTHGGFFHTAYASTIKKLFFNTVTKFSLRAYKQIYACSIGDFELFSPLCLPKLQLIENGVDTTKYHNAASKVHTRKFVYIGRFSDNKGLDRLVSTFADLKTYGDDYHLNIIGKDWDGNKTKLEYQIKTLGLQAQISIETDLNDSAIKCRLENASYIVSASSYEGFGLTIVEGMSAGLIPVVSSIPSFERIITSSNVGLITRFENPQTDALNIHQFCEQTEKNYSVLRERAITESNRYSWPLVAKKFSQAYNEYLGINSRLLQGVSIAVKSKNEVMSELDDKIEHSQITLVAFANAHTLNLANQDNEYSTILENFLVLNDGTGVDIASKWKYGSAFIENLNGTDFIPYYFTHSQKRLRIFLLGAKPEVVEQSFLRCKALYPQLDFVGYHHGYIDITNNEALLLEIKATGANVLLVGMGNPLQEKWIHKNAHKTGVTLIFGVGALLDFIADRIPRAPVWIRQMHCEWIYRLLLEPSRLWKRYLIGNFAFLWRAWRERRSYR
jgi:alpha-1,3-mannosyltransferase